MVSRQAREHSLPAEGELLVHVLRQALGCLVSLGGLEDALELPSEPRLVQALPGLGLVLDAPALEVFHEVARVLLLDDVSVALVPRLVEHIRVVFRTYQSRRQLRERSPRHRQQLIQGARRRGRRQIRGRVRHYISRTISSLLVLAAYPCRREPL